jgi:hypothetical protein
MSRTDSFLNLLLFFCSSLPTLIFLLCLFLSPEKEQTLFHFYLIKYFAVGRECNEEQRDGWKGGAEVMLKLLSGKSPNSYTKAIEGRLFLRVKLCILLLLLKIFSSLSTL